MLGLKRNRINLKLIKGKQDFYTAQLNDVPYHSVYNPVIEAERFIAQTVPTLANGPFVVIGSGLGYLEAELYKLKPCSKVISIPNHKLWLTTPQLLIKQEFCYSYDRALSSFLANFLFDYELNSIQILSWPADKARNQPLEDEVVLFLKQLQASCLTVANFGLRWFKNAFNTYLRVKQTVQLPLINQICIAASGPSLQQALPFLKQYQHQFFIIALPSSITFLNFYAIKIDMVVTTDGGYYAKLHLLNLNKNVIIACPLLAQTVPNLPHYFFSFGTPLEKQLLPNAPCIQWAGTVAASAVDLALQLTTGSVILAGQDFCPQGLQQHIRPHSSDRLLMALSYRLKPLTTIYQQFQFSPALNLYAQWFKNQQWPSRLKRLNPSTVNLNMTTIKETDIKETGVLWTNDSIKVSPHLPNLVLINETFNRWLTFPDSKEAKLLAFYLDTANYLKGKNNLLAIILKLKDYVDKLIAGGHLV